MPGSFSKVRFDWSHPYGTLRVVLAGNLIERVQLNPNQIFSELPTTQTAPGEIVKFLDAYFSGASASANPDWLVWNASDFATAVYRALMRVPFGQVLTYGQLAHRAGFSSRHARAVGQVMNKNPFPLFVPCHRVVASDHRLGGFGAGLPVKVKLLEHEGISVSAKVNDEKGFFTQLEKAAHAP